MMNDAEIIKALEYCINNTLCLENCEKCPYKEQGNYCMNEMLKDCLNLIKRQQAEIEGLQFDISELSKRITTLMDEEIRIASQRDEYLHRLALGVAWDNKPIVITSPELTDNVLSIACNNAIKEFAEKLKATFPDRQNSRCTLDDCYTLDIIDNLVKQMTGGEDDV